MVPRPPPPDDPRAGGPSKWAHVICDVAVFVVFLALSAPATTGLAGHEWLAVPFIPIFLGHLVTSWSWITAVLRRGARPRGRPRTNRTLDVLLFVVMVTAVYSGFAISVDLLPSVGLDVAPRDFWVSLHSASSTLLVPLVAAHLVLHWRWTRRNVLQRRIHRRSTRMRGGDGVPSTSLRASAWILLAAAAVIGGLELLDVGHGVSWFWVR